MLKETLAARNRQIPAMTNGEAWGYFAAWTGLGIVLGCSFNLVCYIFSETGRFARERMEEEENGDVKVITDITKVQVYKPVRIPALKGTLYVRKWIWRP